jgi:hypothetical protein
MQSFKDVLRKNISEKYQWKRMLLTIALNVIKDYFNIPEPEEWVVRDKEIISWFLKYEVLFLRTQDQSLKIAIHKDKEKVITEINNHFSNLWYTSKVSEIRFTA